MNIFAIGLNYREHINEFHGEQSNVPTFFMKSSTAYLPNSKPFFMPDFTDRIDYETELVIKIGRLGKYIQPQFALRYIQAYTIGLDLTARTIQKECRQKGLPWEISKSFDGSAPIGEFIPYNQDIDLQNINFHLNINGTTVQQGNTNQMIFTIPEIISYLSQYFTLQNGDLIFTGTPAGVGPINKEDFLEGYLEGKKVLSLKVK